MYGRESYSPRGIRGRGPRPMNPNLFFPPPNQYGRPPIPHMEGRRFMGPGLLPPMPINDSQWDHDMHGNWNSGSMRGSNGYTSTPYPSYNGNSNQKVTKNQKKKASKTMEVRKEDTAGAAGVDPSADLDVEEIDTSNESGDTSGEGITTPKVQKDVPVKPRTIAQTNVTIGLNKDKAEKLIENITTLEEHKKRLEESDKVAGQKIDSLASQTKLLLAYQDKMVSQLEKLVASKDTGKSNDTCTHILEPQEDNRNNRMDRTFGLNIGPRLTCRYSSRPEVEHAIEKRERKLQREDWYVIPENLQGYKLENFQNLEDFGLFMEDMFSALYTTRAIFARQLNVDDGLDEDWKELIPREDGISDTNSVAEIPTSTNPTTSTKLTSKQVEFKQVGVQCDKVSNNHKDHEGRNTYDQNFHETYHGNTHRGDHVAHDTQQHTKSNREHYHTNTDRENHHSNREYHHSNRDYQDTRREYHTDADITYNKYKIPHQFRAKPYQPTNTGDDLTNTSNHNTTTRTQTAGRQDTGQESMAQVLSSLQGAITAMPNSQLMNMFTQFDGSVSKYKGWKQSTQTLLNRIDAELRPIVLRQNLSSDDKAMLSHIENQDYGALESMWKQLDKVYGSVTQLADYHMSSLVRWMREGARCSDYKSLAHLKSKLQRHYFGMCRLGPEATTQAESISYGVSTLLFGKSAREVNRMRHQRPQDFSVMEIFNIIDRHLEDLQYQDNDDVLLQEGTTDSLPKGYAEEDIPFLREHNRRKYYGSKGESSSRSGKYYSQDRYRSTYGDREHYYSKNRSHSGDNRDNRRKYYHDRSRSHSKDSRDYKEVSGYSKDRSDKYSRRTPSRSPSKHDYRSNSRDSSASYYVSTEKGGRRESRSPRKVRTRDPTPYRGSTSKSPVRKDTDRPQNSYRCNFCASDGHDALDCRVLQPWEMFDKCLKLGLCFVCFKSDHLSVNCQERAKCKDSSCIIRGKHNSKICHCKKE